MLNSIVQFHLGNRFHSLEIFISTVLNFLTLTLTHKSTVRNAALDRGWSAKGVTGNPDCVSLHPS